MTNWSRSILRHSLGELQRHGRLVVGGKRHVVLVASSSPVPCDERVHDEGEHGARASCGLFRARARLFRAHGGGGDPPSTPPREGAVPMRRG